MGANKNSGTASLGQSKGPLCCNLASCGDSARALPESLFLRHLKYYTTLPWALRDASTLKAVGHRESHYKFHYCMVVNLAPLLHPTPFPNTDMVRINAPCPTTSEFSRIMKYWPSGILFHLLVFHLIIIKMGSEKHCLPASDTVFNYCHRVNFSTVAARASY